MTQSASTRAQSTSTSAQSTSTCAQPTSTCSQSTSTCAQPISMCAQSASMSTYTLPNYSASSLFVQPDKCTIICVSHCSFDGLLNYSRKSKVILGETHTKLDKLRDLLQSTTQLQLFCITESKLSKVINDSELFIDGYTLLRADRNRHSGRIAIYCSHSLKSSCIYCDDIKRVEYLCIKISPSNVKHLIVCCIYRPYLLPTNWKNAFLPLQTKL